MRIVPEGTRLILDPPTLDCPHCGGDGFHVRARASGFVHEHHSMRTGAITSNEGMYDDLHLVQDDRAFCDTCGEPVGRIIGSDADPHKMEDSRTSLKVVEIVCLADVRDGLILLVRKRGQDFLILPGGKPEPREAENAALSRELMEELGVGTRRKPRFVGVFRDAAGGVADVDVVVHLHEGELAGEPSPMAEIESLHWTDVETGLQDDGSRIPLAPSLRNLILPYLAARARRAADKASKG